MATYFSSFKAYFEDADCLIEKIKRLRAIRNAMLDTLASSAMDDDVTEYRLNDGQTIINVTRRSVDQISDGLRKIELLINMYSNQVNGRVTRAVNHEDTRFLTIDY